MKWNKIEGNLVTYYDDGEEQYIIHSADRTEGENTGKWVCCYYSRGTCIPREGYFAIRDGHISYFGGNAMFCAMGMPAAAEYNSIKDAKEACKEHSLIQEKALEKRLLREKKQKSDCRK